MRAALFVALAASAAAQSWSIVDPSVSGVATGVAFTSDSVGYVCGASNGVGPQILKSTDGGSSWAPCKATFGLDLLLLDLDATENTVVVSSIFGELYSIDGGATFGESIGGGTSQSVRYLGVNGDGGLKFGVTGQYGNVQGAGISTDGGITFTTYNAKLTSDARYGAFPSDTQWYIAAGDWPNNSKNRTQRLLSKSVFMRGGYHFPATYTPRSEEDGAGKAGYTAQIATTQDGGATWKTVFNVDGQFYFNAIDCQPNNPNWCCAVGEADSDSPTPGSRIHCTQDGGSSWNRTYYAKGDSTTGYSMFDIAYATDNDVWALGSILNSIFGSVQLLYSGNGGLTWTQAKLDSSFTGFSGLGLSFIDATHAWAALDNTLGGSSAIAEYS